MMRKQGEIDMSILDKMTKEQLCKLRLRFMAKEAEYARKRREVERKLILQNVEVDREIS